MANPIQFDRFKPSARPECMRCEELLADAVDEVLSPADQVFFDCHLAGCTDCMTALADARRGAAWLEMLKLPRPEPSAQLMERILAQTSGAEINGADGPAQLITVPASAGMLEPQYPAYAPRILPFRPRLPLLEPQRDRLSRVLFEPRLAMTAAMAFFSIALTLNLTGIRLDQLHASDLRPDHLKHSYYEATASVARRCEGLRLVHTLESRVDDLREASRDDRDGVDTHEDRLGGISEHPQNHRSRCAAGPAAA